MPRPGFDGHITQGSERQPMVGLKIVQEPALGAVAENLIMNMKEDLLR